MLQTGRAQALCHWPTQSHRPRHPDQYEQLWAVVNERDEIGPDLVPDYLTSVREGGFYGWPYSYWGQMCERVRPQDPDKVAFSGRARLQPRFTCGGARCRVLYSDNG